MTRRAANIIIIAAAAAMSSALFSVPADAARCQHGYIYRPSKGVCQYRAHYVKQARVRYNKARYVKASVRHRIKRERPAKRARATPAMRANATLSPPTPMWYFMEPNPFNQPYGRLVVMLQNYDPKLASWASMQLWNIDE